jgi:hypothetical protein
MTLERRTAARLQRYADGHEVSMREVIGRCAFFFGSLLLGSTAIAQNEVLNPRLARAMNVAIGFDTGFDFTQHPPSTEDREALYAVRQGLERSGRYWIVSNPKDAELLIAIRVRFVLDASSGKPVRRHGLTFRGEGHAKADILSVYDARFLPLGNPLWRGVQFGGLSGDRPALLASFEGDVERLARQR